MSKVDPGFPYALTFCRPCDVLRKDQKHVFATVSDGHNTCSITMWPRSGLPFSMRADGVLLIRVFAAVDAALFERGIADELGSCCLPLRRIPELVQAESLHTDTPQSTSGNGPVELWLALDAPAGGAGRRRQRRPSASASPVPGNSPVNVECSTGHHVGHQNSFGNDSSCSRGRLDSSCSSESHRECPRTRSRGFTVSIQEESESVEILGHDFLFERSRRIASSGQIVPRIRIIVQVRNEVSFGALAVEPVDSPVNPDGNSIGGFGFGSTPPSLSMLAGSALLSNVMLQQPQMESFGLAPHAPFQGSSASDVCGHTPTPQMLEPPPQRALIPLGSSHAADSDAVWQARRAPQRTNYKHPAQERERLERSIAQHAEDVRGADAKVYAASRKLDHLRGFVVSHMLRSFAGMAFDAWLTWMVEEKSRRQFGQLTEDYVSTCSAHETELAQLSESREAVAASVRECERKTRRHVERWQSCLATADGVVSRDVSRQRLASAMGAWRIAVQRGRLARGMVRRHGTDMLRGLVFVVFVIWQFQVGEAFLKDLQQRASSAESDVPRLARQISSAHITALYGLQHIRSRSAWHARLNISVSATLGDASYSCFVVWAWLIGQRSRGRRLAAKLSLSPLWGSFDEVFLKCCVVAWRGVSSKVTRSKATEQCSGRGKIQECQRLVASMSKAILERNILTVASSVFTCWAFEAEHQRVQAKLEVVLQEQEEAEEQCLRWERDARQARADLDSNRARRQEHCDALADWLQQVQHEQENDNNEFASLASKQLDTEMEQADACQRSRELMAEYTMVREQTLHVSEEARLAHERGHASEVEEWSQIAEAEKLCASLQLSAEQLRSEISKQTERQFYELRSAWQSSRAQASKLQENLRRHVCLHDDSRKAWALKLKNAEATVARLEQEAQQLRQQHQDSDNVRAAVAAEAEQSLLSRVCAAERRLETAEAVDKARREELAQELVETAALQERREFLEERWAMLQGRAVTS